MRLTREWKAKEDSLFTRNAEKENGRLAQDTPIEGSARN
jgi:hypothetical protein